MIVEARKMGGWVFGNSLEGAPPPLLSIVTIVRRDPTGVAATLQSVSRVRFKDFEHIVIEGDDVDQPEMAKIRRSVMGDPSISWCLEPDSGVYSAMNKGIMASRGEWIWYVNAGDKVAQDIDVEKLYAALRSAPSQWLVADARVVDGNGRVERLKRSDDYTAARLRAGTYTPCHQAVFCRRLQLAAIGGFSEDFRIAGDYDLFLALAQRSAPIKLPMVVIDYLSGGMSEKMHRRSALEYARARRLQLNLSKVDASKDALLTNARVLARWLKRRERQFV